MHTLMLLCINQHRKFVVANIANYNYMIGSKQNLKNGSRDPDQAY